ncbi:hypothetical protein A5724_14385 [Mycobacterium sp. ACS1612]|uniref:hypothetical protein n=1 Tax=Mycobacterium sp. ACS1612 TaxID=1834117 RepID=UPI0007FE75EC|nr:hypothetical protein [Mycobacterium sp. ACS1612]OBF35992.1 hypothetical protein A5724_14385 [Mycobacterium sp. ACS1612]
MSNNRISPDILSAASDALRWTPAPRPSLVARVTARLRADTFDHQLAVGVAPVDGSALAAHQARLTSRQEREAIARSLQHAVNDARSGAVFSSRIPLHSRNISAAEELIDRITLRLHSPRPVSARGMARLRRVLSDGSGPFYWYGKGDLAGRLGAALAAL